MTRTTRIAALFLSAATAAALVGCTQPRELTPEDRTAASTLADQLQALPGVTEAEVTPHRDAEGSPGAEVVVQLTDVPDADLAVQAVNRVTEAARASALATQRRFPITGVAHGTVGGTPFRGEFFRDGALMGQSHAQALGATLAVARADGIGEATIVVSKDVDPLSECFVFASQVSPETLRSAVAPIPPTDCRMVRRWYSTLPEPPIGDLPSYPPSAEGLLDLQVAAPPGSDPSTLPVDAAASLMTDPTLVSAYLGSVPHIRVDSARTTYGPDWDGNDQASWPTASPPPSEDAVRAALETLRSHPGGITVRLELPVGVTIRIDGAGTISVDRPESSIPPTNQTYLELIQKVAESLN